jgi:aminopeptidase YwaD
MKKLILLIFISTYFTSNSQSLAFGRKLVDTLASKYFWGRGYTKDGIQRAEKFLEAEFKSYGLTPMNKNSFLQKYSYHVNTFPKAMKLSIHDLELIPGKDFIVSSEARGIKAIGNLIEIDSVTYINKKEMLMIKLVDKLTWSVSSDEAEFTKIEVNKKSLTKTANSFSAHIDNDLIKNFKVSNICGYVKGTRAPDSFLLLSAHYDHLGGMGSETYFPGANDNASGVSLLLNLAQYYAKNPQDYSIGFILFSGEEIGLKGSKHFIENPLIPLDKIRFLMNTDLAGTGEDGITVVNATEFKTEFELLKKINADSSYLKAINPRGKAANSDHYFFTEKGVPSFFFYTQGGIGAYHDIYDLPETLPLTEHEDLFKLITRFFSHLSKAKTSDE